MRLHDNCQKRLSATGNVAPVIQVFGGRDKRVHVGLELIPLNADSESDATNTMPDFAHELIRIGYQL
jgi:hypothetical protein